MVLEDPALIPQMSEEALRMVSPVIHAPHGDRGCRDKWPENRQGRKSRALVWSGKCDPEVFATPIPSTCIVPTFRHLAFGHGVHKCLGSRIAKIQLRLAFERIFSVFRISIGQASKRFRLTPWCMLFPAFR